LPPQPVLIVDMAPGESRQFAVHVKVYVQINRPEARNALDMATRKALAAAFEGLHDDASVRPIVLTGNEQAFAAGADLKELVDAGARSRCCGAAASVTGTRSRTRPSR
jgi:enoyl-CoA hydratase/carnithine racemase